jgi:hypothetical protein
MSVSRRLMSVVMLVGAATFTAGCLPAIALPTLGNDGSNCRGVGLNAILAGDPRDPRVAWLAMGDGRRQEIVWPVGFRAQFTPELEILDARGRVVLRAGDPVDSGCVIGGAPDLREPLLIVPN